MAQFAGTIAGAVAAIAFMITLLLVSDALKADPYFCDPDVEDFCIMA